VLSGDVKAKVDVDPVMTLVIDVSGSCGPTVTVRLGDATETLRAMSVARAAITTVPLTGPTSRDHSPFDDTAPVPRDVPLTKNSMVVPGSAVPLTTKVVGTELPSTGLTMTGADGGMVSTRTTSIEDEPEVPPAFLAFAVKR
jgi:hypothetical protein